MVTVLHLKKPLELLNQSHCMFLCCVRLLISACLLAWFGEIKSALGDDRMLKLQPMDLVFPKSTGY